MLGIAIVFVFNLLLLPSDSSSYYSCTNSRVPLKLKSPLKFCANNGTVCCDSAEDLRLQKQFEAMNISDPECASLVKSVICSVCYPFSAHLVDTGSASKHMPLLCNSSALMELHQSIDKVSSDFCTKVWETCGNASNLDSPFSGPEQRVGMMNHQPSERAFCETIGASSDDKTVCYSGETESLVTAEVPETPRGVCLEKIGNRTYLAMAPHPDGSNRVFLANQRGKIWLATIPEEGSKRLLQVDESKPFLNLSDRILFDTEYGLVGMAFHPNFVNNGRFFVSYYCDKMQHAGCLGRCSCNTDVNCDPSKFAADNGIQPCQYHAVIGEYTTNGTSSKPDSAKKANPTEVRRIFTFGLPSRGVHGGQILIGPEDGHLYYMMGDNVRGDDRPSFAQNKKSILGKILRLDIDHIPSAKEIHDQGLWGSYSIPRDNPYINYKELAPEIWALGVRLPWRCSFDSERPSYLICGDCGQEQYEEVDIVKRGGNYGWPVYEGPYFYHPENIPRPSTPASSIRPISPVMGYNHSEFNIGSASVSGGFVYRSVTDPCMYGRYLYMDVYGSTMWLGTESPKNSGNFTTAKIGFSCAHDSPMQCASTGGDNVPALGFIQSFGEDNRKDIYVMSTAGVYRVARPSRCKYQCSIESFANTKSNSSAPISGQSWNSVQLYISFSFYLLLLLVILL